MGCWTNLTPKLMPRGQGREVELLTSQHYNFSTSVLTQEWLHEVVAHREEFGGWRDINKDDGEKIIPLGRSLFNSHSQQYGGIMNYLGKFQCPPPDKSFNQLVTDQPTNKQPTNQPSNQSSNLSTNQSTSQQIANQFIF